MRFGVCCSLCHYQGLTGLKICLLVRHFCCCVVVRPVSRPKKELCFPEVCQLSASMRQSECKNSRPAKNISVSEWRKCPERVQTAWFQSSVQIMNYEKRRCGVGKTTCYCKLDVLIVHGFDFTDPNLTGHS